MERVDGQDVFLSFKAAMATSRRLVPIQGRTRQSRIHLDYVMVQVAAASA